LSDSVCQPIEQDADTALALVESVDPHLGKLLRHQLNREPEVLPFYRLRGEFGQELRATLPSGRRSLAFVTQGAVEVSESDSHEIGEAESQFARYVARPGEMLGVFEFVQGSSSWRHRLFAGCRFGYMLPRSDNKAFTHALARRTGLNAHQAISAGIRSRLNGDYAELILLPQELFEGGDEDSVSIRHYLFEAAARGFSHALSRVRLDVLRRVTSKLGDSEVKSRLATGAIDSETVWLPIQSVPYLNQSVADELHTDTDAVAREKLGSSAVAITHEGNRSPIYLLPCIFGWREVSWGLIPGRVVSPETETFINHGGSSTYLDRHANTICFFSGSSRRSPDTASLNRLRVLFKATIEVSMNGHTVNDKSRLFERNAPGNLSQQLDLAFALKSSFLAQRLLSQAAAHRKKAKSVVCVQHVLRCIHELLLYTRSSGFADQVSILGKSYSSSPEVLRQMLIDGIRATGGPPDPSFGNWEDEHRKSVKDLIERTDEAESQLYVDDGGYLISEVIDRRLGGKPSSRQDSAGVELTTSGAMQIRSRGDGAFFPIVNVAQCWVKRNIESPLIAQAVADKCARSFVSLLDRRSHIVILGGNGALGKSLVDWLKSEARVPPTIDNIDRDGTGLVERLCAALAGATAVFGCTGTDAFASLGTDTIRAALKRRTEKNMQPLELISCSSGDIEFRRLIQLVNRIGEPIDRFPASDLYINDPDNGGLSRLAIIRRGGFPVNFSNSPDSVPLPDIRLTTSLLAAGMAQASIAPESSRGLLRLEPALQALIAKQWFLTVSARKDVSAIHRSAGFLQLASLVLDSNLQELTEHIRDSKDSADSDNLVLPRESSELVHSWVEENVTLLKSIYAGFKCRW
jgi:hypothetical protein